MYNQKSRSNRARHKVSSPPSTAGLTNGEILFANIQSSLNQLIASPRAPSHELKKPQNTSNNGSASPPILQNAFNTIQTRLRAHTSNTEDDNTSQPPLFSLDTGSFENVFESVKQPFLNSVPVQHHNPINIKRKQSDEIPPQAHHTYRKNVKPSHNFSGDSNRLKHNPDSSYIHRSMEINRIQNPRDVLPTLPSSLLHPTKEGSYPSNESDPLLDHENSKSSRFTQSQLRKRIKNDSSSFTNQPNPKHNNEIVIKRNSKRSSKSENRDVHSLRESLRRKSIDSSVTSGVSTRQNTRLHMKGDQRSALFGARLGSKIEFTKEKEFEFVTRRKEQQLSNERLMKQSDEQIEHLEKKIQRLKDITHNLNKDTTSGTQILNDLGVQFSNGIAMMKNTESRTQLLKKVGGTRGMLRGAKCIIILFFFLCTTSLLYHYLPATLQSSPISSSTCTINGLPTACHRRKVRDTHYSDSEASYDSDEDD